MDSSRLSVGGLGMSRSLIPLTAGDAADASLHSLSLATLKKLYDDRVHGLVQQVRQLVTSIHSDEALAALKLSGDTSEFVTTRIAELADTALSQEQEAAIHRLVQHAAVLHGERSRAEADADQWKAECDKVTAVLHQRDDQVDRLQQRIAELETAINDVTSARELEKGQAMDRLEAVRQAMASKADAEGVTAALHMEKSQLLQQVAEWQSHARELQTAAEQNLEASRAELADVTAKLDRSKAANKELKAKYLAVGDRIQELLAGERRDSEDAIHALEDRVRRHKAKATESQAKVAAAEEALKLAEERSEASIRALTARLEGERESSQTNLELRLHAKYEAMVAEKLAERRHALEDQVQRAKLLEAEITALRQGTVGREEHQRVVDTQRREAAKEAALAVEAEYARKTQKVVDDLKRVHAEEVRRLTDVGTANEDALSRERTARRDAEEDCGRAQRELATHSARVSELERGRDLLSAHLKEAKENVLALKSAVEQERSRRRVVEDALGREQEAKANLQTRVSRLDQTTAALMTTHSKAGGGGGGGGGSEGGVESLLALQADQAAEILRLEGEVKAAREEAVSNATRAAAAEEVMKANARKAATTTNATADGIESTVHELMEWKERARAAETRAGAAEAAARKANAVSNETADRLTDLREDYDSLHAKLVTAEQELQRESRKQDRVRMQHSESMQAVEASKRRLLAGVGARLAPLRESLSLVKSSVAMEFETTSQLWTRNLRDLAWRVQTYASSVELDAKASASDDVETLKATLLEETERQRSAWEAEMQLRESRARDSGKETERRLEEVHKAMEEGQDALARERAARAHADDQLREQAASLERVTGQLAVAEQTVDDLQHTIASLEARVTETDGAIRTATDTRDTALRHFASTLSSLSSVVPLSADVIEGVLTADPDLHAASLQRMDDEAREFVDTLRQTAASESAQPVRDRLAAREEDLTRCQDELRAVRVNETALKAELETVTSTCSALQAEILRGEDKAQTLTAELEAARSRDHQLRQDYETVKLAETHLRQELAVASTAGEALASEKERSSKLTSKVRELRMELLQVASEADRRLGSERGAKEVAQRELEKASRELGRSMEKYREKDRRVHQLKEELSRSMRATQAVMNSKDGHIGDLQDILHKSASELSGVLGGDGDGDRSVDDLQAASARLSRKVRQQLGSGSMGLLSPAAARGPPLRAESLVEASPPPRG